MGDNGCSEAGEPHELLKVCGEANSYAEWLRERAQAKQDDARNPAYCNADPRTWSQRIDKLSEDDSISAVYIRKLVGVIDSLRNLASERDQFQDDVNALIEACYHRTKSRRIAWKIGNSFGVSNAGDDTPEAYMEAIRAIRRAAGVPERMSSRVQIAAFAKSTSRTTLAGPQEENRQSVRLTKVSEREDLIMNEVQQPSIGRIVHYVLPGGPRKGQHRPAIITEVWQPIEHETAPGMSNLTVFRGQADDFVNREGDPDYTPAWVGSALYCPNSTPGTWHWPERV